MNIINLSHPFIFHQHQGGSLLENGVPPRVILPPTPGSLYPAKVENLNKCVHPSRQSEPRSLAPDTDAAPRRDAPFPRTTFHSATKKGARGGPSYQRQERQRMVTFEVPAVALDAQHEEEKNSNVFLC